MNFRFVAAVSAAALGSLLLSTVYFGGFSSLAVVSGGGTREVNGAYTWETHNSLKQHAIIAASRSGTAVPNAMEVLVALSHRSMYSTSPPLSIQRSGQSWLLGVPPSKVLYASPQSDALPLSGWTIRAGGGDMPAPTIERADAPPAEVPPSAPSKFWSSPFMSTLRGQPINCTIILFCCYIWYHLRQRGWGWEEVGSSYKNVVQEGQVWRMFTSSFAHVDLLHLAMNMISLYQVGWLEMYYGSFLYAVLSATLVVLTMVIGMLTYHVLIVYFRKEHYIQTIGVGYSCVLFAWIVVSTSKAESYCPLPGLQSVCIPTWQVPLPFSSGSTFPFSAAPFVLLIAMHYLIPKASFVGHLSGILIGYPLAWGLMDWCGIELLARLLVFAMYCRELAFGTDRRVVSLGSPAPGGSFDGTHISPADVPTVMHDGSRSKLLLSIACSYIAVTALSFSSSSWPVFLGEVSLCLLLVIVWRSSVAFSLPGLAAVGTNTLSTQAASKHVTYYCLVAVIDIFAGLALLPALLLIPSPSSAFSFGVLCRILSITLSTFGLLVSVKLLHRATSETDAPLVTVVPGVLLAVFSFGRLPVGTLPSFASSSGSIMENGVLVPRAAASSRLQSAGRVLGEGRRLGSG